MPIDKPLHSTPPGTQEPATAPAPTQKIQVDADGCIHVPAFTLPMSSALSPEARQMLIASLLRSGGLALPSFAGLDSAEEFVSYVENFRATLDEQFIGPLSRALEGAFPLGIRQTTFAGVPVETFTPPEQANERRVLINLHGGAFMSGAIHVARVESLPLAHLGKIKVVSVDYRQAHEHKYPAASEDVAAVYRE